MPTTRIRRRGAFNNMERRIAPQAAGREEHHLQGSYIVSSSTGAPGDGVVLINGTQVLRVPTGEPPYQVREFDADISAHAGQYVLMEVLSDNGVRGAAADWLDPRIVIAR